MLRYMNMLLTNHDAIHSTLLNIMLVAMKVRMVLRSYVELTWKHDNRELV